MAAIELQRVPFVRTQVEALAQALLAALDGPLAVPGAEAAIRNAYAGAQKFDYDSSFSIDPLDGYVDLAHFAGRLLLPANEISPAVDTAAQAVIDAVGAPGIPNSAVVALRTLSGTSLWSSSPWDFSNATGLSIYLPLGEQDVRPTGMIVAPGELAPENQLLEYYVDPTQLAFTRDAPSWAQLLSRLDPTTPPRDLVLRGSFRTPFPAKSLVTASALITPGAGGTLTVRDNGFEIEIVVPPGAVTEPTTLTYTGRDRISPPLPAGDTRVHPFRLSARGESGTPLELFLLPYRMTIRYPDAALALLGVAEADLNLLYFDSALWRARLPCARCSIDWASNRLIFEGADLGPFALAARPGDGAGEDLTADPAGLLAPPSLLAGNPAELRLDVRRINGKSVISDVVVRFYQGNPLAGGILIGNATVPLLAPHGNALSSAVIWNPAAPGVYEIFALIDPDDLFPEADATNNTIVRSFVVRAAGVDALAPRVEAFSVAGGAANTATQTVSTSITAVDPLPGSGVTDVRVIEYIFDFATGQWAPLGDTGWTPYVGSPTVLPITLGATAGARYLDAWARDAAGNISLFPFRALINYLPASDSIGAGETRVYRYRLAAGAQFTVRVIPLSGDPDLYIWAPDADSGRGPWISNLRGGVDTVTLIAPIDGVYQVEVFGFTDAVYSLETTITPAPAEAKAEEGGIDATKPARSRPALSPASTPAETLPPDSVVLWRRMFVPMLGRSG
jgi:hypothetical protein